MNYREAKEFHDRWFLKKPDLDEEHLPGKDSKWIDTKARCKKLLTSDEDGRSGSDGLLDSTFTQSDIPPIPIDLISKLREGDPTV